MLPDLCCVCEVFLPEHIMDKTKCKMRGIEAMPEQMFIDPGLGAYYR